MKRLIGIIIILLTALFFTNAAAYAYPHIGPDDEEFDVRESSSIDKDVTFSGAGAQHLVIDNIFGSITVTGYSGSTVKVSAKKLIKALGKKELEKAKKDVKLDISSKENKVRLYVDGPFRKDDDKICWNFDEFGYIVKYDFQVKVPRNTSIWVKTINNGDIEVTDIKGKCIVKNVNGKVTVAKINGDFEIITVNGRIKMDGMAGSGKAHTVNGKVISYFTQNPASDCSFHTINGDVKLVFLPKLSADFKVKTFHGDILSDFPVSYLPMKPGKGERKHGKYIYKSNRFQGVRVGNGGPVIKMDTLNGDIIIAKK